jgi:hypothetical protein
VLYTSLFPSSGYLTEDACLLDSGEPGSYGKLVQHTATSSLILGILSIMSRPSKFKDSQAKEGCILNDRLGKDVKFPPIALLYAPLVDLLTTFATVPRDSLVWVYESFNLPLTGLPL